MDELKSCPFCGSKAQLFSSNIYCGNTEYFARCINDECHCTLESEYSKEKAIEAWNTSTVDEKYQKLISLCKDILRPLDHSLDIQSESALHLVLKKLLKEIGENES